MRTSEIEAQNAHSDNEKADQDQANMPNNVHSRSVWPLGIKGTAGYVFFPTSTDDQSGATGMTGGQVAGSKISGFVGVFRKGSDFLAHRNFSEMGGAWSGSGPRVIPAVRSDQSQSPTGVNVGDMTHWKNHCSQNIDNLDLLIIDTDLWQPEHRPAGTTDQDAPRSDAGSIGHPGVTGGHDQSDGREHPHSNCEELPGSRSQDVNIGVRAITHQLEILPEAQDGTEEAP
jgi:hypothetical protein